ncbi:hypothetical protein [Oscillatoria salina]|uniref:hypothetical protein n=1 Tax=Oscillatoria salina TaxID=331517 RepID=UPI0013BCCD89|nr:hypothetical protein [Oscillatoria salina]MBZ8183257.1 hypothetical protein [Oscillatoria salina IIICB1]NET89938.1 hypothetical protein [Kamptonema sp. SIO1D9]
MANYSCIAIGINRYLYLQPLNYAQADAQAIAEILANVAELPPEQCLLLTDASNWVEEQPTYPTRENILSWLDNIQNNLAIQWFFFSGYGVNWEGVDYLMPVDGNPADIPGSAIAMRELFESLRDNGSDRLLVLLDINRSPGLFAGSSVGVETKELAEEMGISLVLSTEPGEFSHESADLARGIFTAGLLEALNYFQKDINLENLDRYLRDRLPELSEHHWRPVQTPVTIIPSPQAALQPLLPQPERENDLWQLDGNVPDTVEALAVNSQAESNGTGTIAPTAVSTLERPTASIVSPTKVPAVNNNALTAYDSPDSPPGKKPTWQVLLLIAGSLAIFAAAVFAAVLLGDRDRLPEETSADPARTTVSPITEPPLDSDVTEVPANSNQTIPAPEATEVPPTVSEIAPSRGATDNATVAPSPPPNPTASPASTATLEANRELLNRATTYIQSNQASGFSRAINEVRQIEPGAPLYNEAQAAIARWSQVILDIAQGRAEEDNYAGAIAAAKLVPNDVPQIKNAANQAIVKWSELAELKWTNQNTIAAAQEQINPAQASSYSFGISLLRKINSGEPEYRQAQQLIEEWSRQIYLMANSRAAGGNLNQAIETAKLVPRNTPSYDQAQNAIARWQQGQR